MNIELYTKPGCIWCDTVKGRLEELGLSYSEVDVTTTRGAISRLMEVETIKHLTVPQVFIDGQHAGNADQFLNLSITPIFQSMMEKSNG